MNRNLKGIILFIVCPTVGGLLLALLMAVVCGLAGIERDSADLLNRSWSYVAGVVVGWWIWGAR